MLSKDTYARLKSMLTRKSLADEFQSLVSSPGAPSSKLKAAILSAMCNKKAANELVSSLSTAGLQPLSGPKHPNAARRFRDAMCRKSAADEIANQI